MLHRHSVPLRGLLSSRRSQNFEGRFGRMFRALMPAFDPGDDKLRGMFDELGDAMSAPFEPPKDGPDPEESGIPALYTYFGQFVDHDITFDPASSLQKQNDPDALIDYRTPALDLDNLYGRGPADQPYMYDWQHQGEIFLLSDVALKNGGDAGARDLPRGPNGRALIGDPRNDENAIVSQLQGLFLRFHNRLRIDNPKLSFAEIQQKVRFHYQYLVMNDFLPRIVSPDVLDALKTRGKWDGDKLSIYRPKKLPFIPVEFSVAAYRFGHSIIRPGYRLNDIFLLPIFPRKGDTTGDALTGFRAMNPNWGIDWGRFIDIDKRPYDGTEAIKRNRLQFAYRMDTSLVNPLENLPKEIAENPSSLAQRNLLRGWHLGLPSGQAVARALNLKPLAEDRILIGKALASDGNKKPIADIAGGAFVGRCPLWTYILAEAMLNSIKMETPVKGTVSIDTPQLGPVGGRIVAEVFLGLLIGDAHSYLRLDPDWHPETGKDYQLAHLVSYALGHQRREHSIREL